MQIELTAEATEALAEKLYQVYLMTCKNHKIRPPPVAFFDSLPNPVRKDYRAAARSILNEDIIPKLKVINEQESRKDTG